MKQDLLLYGFIPGQISLFLQRWLYTCGNKVWYLLEEELQIIPIWFAREQAHYSQPSLWVGFGIVEAQSWEHGLNREQCKFRTGGLLKYLSVCICAWLLLLLTCWCSVRNALPQFSFYHAGCRHRERETHSNDIFPHYLSSSDHTMHCGS